MYICIIPVTSPSSHDIFVSPTPLHPGFDDLIPFGPKQLDLPRVHLWPAVVLGRPGEKVSVSVSCV